MLVENRQFEPTPLLFGAPYGVTPLEFRRNLCHRKNLWAIVWRCLRDPEFSRFDTGPACDGQTDRRTDGRTDRHKTTSHTALAWRRAVKMIQIK